MKKLLMISLLLTVVMLSSCARIVPVTSKIIEQVGGEEQLGRFQYYVSKKITMERVQDTTDATVERGKANIVNTTIEDKVLINKSTPGVVISSRYGNDIQTDVLHASFTDSDARFLQFSNFGDNSPNAHFYLVSWEDGEYVLGGDYVWYDNKLYDYETTHSILPSFLRRNSIDEPKLLIKLKKKDRIDRNRRREKGRRIDD